MLNTKSRFSLPLFSALHMMTLFIVLRIALMVTYWNLLPHTFRDILWALQVGLRMDLAITFILLIPQVVYVTFVPNTLFQNKRWLIVNEAVYIFLLYWATFFNVTDYFFFQEFNARLNYVAASYLFETPREVVGTLWESYPMGIIMVVILIGTALFYWPVRSSINKRLRAPVQWKERLAFLTTWLVATAIFFQTINIRLLNANPNRVLDEIGANGFYTFLYAVITNDLHYDTHYAAMDDAAAKKLLQDLVVQPGEKLTGNPLNPLERDIPARKGFGKVNVVIILEESLGSKFVGRFGKHELKLTPNIDRLSTQGLFFTRMHSTGTRTVRGLEAVLASFPPIPGASLVKRKNNSNVATIARLLKKFGYQTEFIYGGRGLFDNMRPFMLDNGYDRFIEQKHFDRPTHTTIWGVCDEDIFNKALDEFDAMHATGTPFFATILSVSNHKPFTYPKGRIDFDPDQHSRDFAVKYSDWALGQFFDKAKSHAFFDNTLFVMLGDHGARVYGADFIPLDTYEIPLLFYAPKLLPHPREYSTLGCSMDVAPTIMGLLGLPYRSVFFGRDLLRLPSDQGYALLQHDRDIAFFNNRGKLGLLSTQHFTRAYAYDSKQNRFNALDKNDSMAKGLVSNAIAFYQTAYHLFDQGYYRFFDEHP